MTTRKTAAKKVPAKAPTRRTAKAAAPAKKTPAKKATAKKPTSRKSTARKSTGAAKRPPAAAPRRTGRKPKPDPRLIEVLQARRDSKSFETIAAELKYPNAAAAFRAFEQGMQLLEMTSVSNERLLERERLEHLQSVLWPEAQLGDPKALDLLLKVIDQKTAIPSPLDNRPDRPLGPVEAGTKLETATLASHAPALAAAVLTLARNVDDNAGDPKAAAIAARELRISMTQLRGLAGTRLEPEHDDTPKPRKGRKSVVVPESRLEQLRRLADSGPSSS